jgi:hypothetical protein
MRRGMPYYYAKAVTGSTDRPGSCNHQPSSMETNSRRFARMARSSIETNRASMAKAGNGSRKP